MGASAPGRCEVLSSLPRRRARGHPSLATRVSRLAVGGDGHSRTLPAALHRARRTRSAPPGGSARRSTLRVDGRATSVPSTRPAAARTSELAATEGRPTAARLNRVRGRAKACKVAVVTAGSRPRAAANEAAGGPLAAARTLRTPLLAPATRAPTGPCTHGGRHPVARRAVAAGSPSPTAPGTPEPPTSTAGTTKAAAGTRRFDRRRAPQLVIDPQPARRHRRRAPGGDRTASGTRRPVGDGRRAVEQASTSRRSERRPPTILTHEDRPR